MPKKKSRRKHIECGSAQRMQTGFIGKILKPQGRVVVLETVSKKQKKRSMLTPRSFLVVSVLSILVLTPFLYQVVGSKSSTHSGYVIEFDQLSGVPALIVSGCAEELCKKHSWHHKSYSNTTFSNHTDLNGEGSHFQIDFNDQVLLNDSGQIQAIYSPLNSNRNIFDGEDIQVKLDNHNRIVSFEAIDKVHGKKTTSKLASSSNGMGQNRLFLVDKAVFTYSSLDDNESRISVSVGSSSLLVSKEGMQDVIQTSATVISIKGQLESWFTLLGIGLCGILGLMSLLHCGSFQEEDNTIY